MDFPLVFFNILSFLDEKDLYIDVAVSYKKCYTYVNINYRDLRGSNEEQCEIEGKTEILFTVIFIWDFC